MMCVGNQRKPFFYSDEPVLVKIAFQCIKVVHNLRILLLLSDEKDNDLLLSHQLDTPGMDKIFHRLDEGIYETFCKIPPNLFGGKTFYVSIHLEYPKTEHLVLQKILSFDVKFQGYNNIHLEYSVVLRPQLEWQMQKIN